MELTQGNAAQRLIRFTFPIIVLNIFGQLYSLVDSVIVAQFAGDHSLSVLAAVNGCMAIGYCLVSGAAGACHIVLANHYGARQFDEFRDAAHTMRLVMAIFSSLVAAAYILLSGTLLRMMHVPAEISDESLAVLWVYALNLQPISVNLVSGAVMNSSGNSKVPMIYGTIAQVMNLVLDYFAVAVWGFGVMGAAAASLFSISAETAWMLLLSGLALNLALTAATVLGADVLTSLYLPDRSGAAFALARSYFLLLIPNYFLQFGKTSLEAVCKAHLKIPLVTVSAMLSLAVRVALGYALAPSYGITALAWATNAGSAAALALCLILYRIRFHGTPA